MDTTTTTTTTARYSIVKLPGKREGFAVFDTAINSTIVGSRSATKREAAEVLAEIKAKEANR